MELNYLKVGGIEGRSSLFLAKERERGVILKLSH